jgi:hypothetical protein
MAQVSIDMNTPIQFSALICLLAAAPPSAASEVTAAEGYLGWGAYSLRGSETRLTGGDAGRSAGFEYETLDAFNVADTGASGKIRYQVALGGGSAGLDGAFDLGLLLGKYLDLGGHGFFLRGGGEVTVLGNQKFYHSLIDLPRMEVGYAVVSSLAKVELAGFGGLALTGRYNTGDTGYRRLGVTPDLGGELILRLGSWPAFAFHGSYEKFLATQNGGSAPVDIAAGAACFAVPLDVPPMLRLLEWIAPPGLQVCAEAASYRGAMAAPAGQGVPVTTRYLQLSLGYGGPKFVPLNGYGDKQ